MLFPCPTNKKNNKMGLDRAKPKLSWKPYFKLESKWVDIVAEVEFCYQPGWVDEPKQNQC